MISPEYLAGIIDGEGSIRIAKIHKGKYRYVLLQAVNTHLPLLKAIKKDYGGRIHDHCNYPPRKPAWTWVTCGPNAERIIDQIYPFLIVKKNKAKEVLKERKSKKVNNN